MTDLTEKFLSGKIHGQEWLSDLDLERMAVVCGIKDTISIARLNALDLGRLLHANRKKHSGNDKYSIPLLLNKGSSGDISSQGSHWVSVILNVDPAQKEIEIVFRDSMHMSSVEQDKIKAELTKAIYYKENSKDIPPKVFQAFPEYKLEFDLVAANATPLPHADNWSCGYHAFKSMVDGVPVAVSNNYFYELKNLSVADTTVEILRRIFYRNLLGSLEVSASALQKASIDKTVVVFDPATHQGQIKEDYLIDFVEHIATVKPNREPVNISPTELYELREIEDESNKELKELKTKFAAELASNTITLDFAEILIESDSSKIFRAKVIALAKLINQHQIAEVAIKNINSLNDADKIEFLNKEFNLLNAMFKIDDAELEHAASQELNLINKRNELIKLLNITIEKDEDPWQEIWRNRISNGAIYQDQMASLGVLNFYSRAGNGGLKNKVNAIVEEIGPRYLQELLQFLQKNKEFFQNREGDFPYKYLALSTYSGDNHTPGKHIFQELDILRHWFEQDGYFPFAKIEFKLFNFSAESFERLKQLIEVVGVKCPNVTELQVHLYNEAGKKKDFTTEQYDELIALYKKNNISLNIDNDGFSLKQEQKRLALENVILENKRSANVKKLQSNDIELTEVVEVEVASEAPESIKKRNIRPYKLQNIDIRKNVNIEINVEEQLEMQQQHQLQTQLQQEVQQQVQLQEQSQVEIDDSSGEYQGSDLIDFEKYTTDDNYARQFVNGLALQKCEPYDYPATPEMASQFWQDTIAKQLFLAKAIKFVTPGALSKISALPQHFIFGFNIDNLPEGFFVQQHAGQFVLCFDETKFIENKNKSPLTVELTSQPIKERLRGEQRNIDRYNFKIDQLNELLTKLDDTPKKDLLTQFQKKYGDIFNAMEAKKGLYALYFVLYEEGYQGLEVLLNALKKFQTKNPELYTHFYSCFIDNKSKISNLVNPSNLNVMLNLPKLSAVEQQWWMTLVSQHVKKNSPTDPAVLFEAFQHFVGRLKEANIPLPYDCPLEDCSNVLVGLDRMLAILGKVDVRNINDQLENMKGLSFHADGAWYAGRWLNFHYFHPAMGLSPDKINEQFEINILGRDPNSLTYRIDFSDLRKMAFSSEVENNDMDYVATLFHRYLGGAARINTNYQYYVELIASLRDQNFRIDVAPKVLALLALTTSGERGSYSQDPMPLFTVIKAADPNRASMVLRALIEELDQWPVKPTLNELTSIVKLAEGNFEKTMQILRESNSVATLESLTLWEQNTKHLPSYDFIRLFERLQSFDPDNMDYLAKIAANLHRPLIDSQVDNLIKLLGKIKSQTTYQEILETLAAIDTAKGKTEHDKLPTIEDLNNALSAVVGKNALRDIFPVLAAQLPDCKFNLAGNMTLPVFDYAGSMEKALDDFNEIVARYNIAPLENEVLKQGLAEGIKGKMQEMEAVALRTPQTAMLWYTIKDNLVYNRVMEVARGSIFSNVNAAIARFPQLAILMKSKFVEPELTKKYESIGPNIVVLTTHANNISNLFSSLLQLNARWNDFNIDFLINSPRANQFTVAQLQRIFGAINLLDVNYIPANLLKSILADSVLKAADNRELNTEEMCKHICHIIELQELDLSQRGKLIDIVTTAKDPAILDDLIKMLRSVKEKHASVLNQCINLLEAYYTANTDKRVINAITDLLNVIGDNAELKQIYFHALGNNVNAFLSISDTLLEDVAVAQRVDFAKILAYSCLEQESDAIEIMESQVLVDQLKDLSKTSEFAELAKLYQQRPYPKLTKLKQFLATKTASERKEFIDTYELDPPGLLAKRENVAKLFDMSGIDQRIDGIRDLSRDAKNPLFYTHRQKLMEQIAFVNSIGHTHNLSVPGISATFPSGADKTRYQKPATQLTKQQLRDLIKHYREMISHAERYSPAEINLAKLEFAALARMAMYRANGGKLPYSTQMLSLLNVMLHGGNIFSEIRTGEGKGSITALFAAAKWMEGGAVDVCSANMELANRDLEEFKDFYEYLGIETQLIRAKTKASAYQQGGINYSDVSELALFQQQADLFHHKLPDKVSCVLDEADFIALDNTTQFRFATSLDESFDPHYNPNEALYPVILEFVASEKFLNKDHPLTAEEDIKALKQFVSNARLKNAVKIRFSKIDDVQLDRWIDSAYTASQLIEGEDFVVRDSNIVREGQSIPVQVAKVKILHRESADSSFSNGVHQFLHTRLNLQINANERSGKKFPIEPEKTYLASKSAKNFIDYYMRRGNVLGLTGTVGSTQEIKEMRKNYGFKFYKIPPHKPLVRKDHAPVLARRQRKGWLWLWKETPQEAHFRNILAKVREFRRRGQPILLFCDGVHSSQALHEFLLKNLGADKLQLYNGEQLGVREKDITDHAGLSEMITVSTPMLGRGTDFKPRYADGDMLPEGLAVLDTFISPDRDSGQKIGRSGRNNARGDTQLIVSEAEFTKHDMKVPKNDKALALAVEKIQAKVNNENFKQRRERQYFADVKDQFFNQYILNCRNIKATIETFYQKLKAEGTAETWQAVQHQCHLVWEQFLNKLDGRWNELVVELHNDLGKLPAAEKLIQEKLWLREKVTSLTEFANKEWVATLTVIETASNEKLTIDFAAASARIVEAQQQPLNAEVAGLLIPNLQLPSYDAQAFKLPPVPVYEETLSNISYNPLNAAQVNVDKVYLNLTDSKSPADNNSIFINELNIIYNALFQADAETSGYGLVTIARISLKKLLDDYHTSYVADAADRNQTSTIALYFRLMNSISKYSNDHFKQAAYDAYTSHIHDYRNDANYVHLLANNMFTMRNAGALPANAAINNEKLLGMSDDMVWQDIKEYAENEFDSYGWALKSSDRSKALDGLKKRLKYLSNSADPASEKIAKLIAAIQQASATAATSDLDHDKKKSRWNIFSYRNVEGSRFQNMLTNIQDKATSFAVVMPDNILPNEKSITYLKELFTQLVDRTDLNRVKKHPIISQIHNDVILISAINRLDFDAVHTSSAKMQEAHKDLLIIYHRLKAYAKNLKAATAITSDSSLSAYTNFMDNIVGKLEKFQFAQETQELASGNNRDNFYTSGAYNLRQNMQNRVESLLRADYVVGKNINLSKFAEVLPGDTEAVKLAQSVLFEVERSLKIQYPKVKSIDLVKDATSYTGDTLTAGFKLTFQNNETFNIPIVVNSLTKEPGAKDFVFVELPNIKGEAVAPVRNKHIVASGVLQPPVAPPEVNRNKKPRARKSAQVVPLPRVVPKNTK